MNQRAIQASTKATIPTGARPLPFLVLSHRLILFLVLQGVVALILALLGEPEAWKASAAWWPVTTTVTNLISIGLIRNLGRREGQRWSELIGADFRKEHIKKDLLVTLGVLLLSAPIAMIPNLGLAALLFGDSQGALDLFIQPLPYWIALAFMVLMPVTHGFAELPTYFAYAMPRLTRRWSNGTSALLVSALFLAGQHVTLPLIFDARFILWRLGMFAPFALFVGWVIQRRPRLLPYLMVLHALIDFSVVMMVWQVSM